MQYVKHLKLSSQVVYLGVSQNLICLFILYLNYFLTVLFYALRVFDNCRFDFCEQVFVLSDELTFLSEYISQMSEFAVKPL